MKQSFMFDYTCGYAAAYIGGFMKQSFMFDLICGFTTA